MKDQIKKLLIDFQGAHSEFQIQNFIIGSAGDDWFQYKQALLEINTRFATLPDLDDQLELALFERERLQARRFVFGRGRRMRHAVNVRRAERRVESLETSRRETRRELAELVKLATELKARVGSLTPEKRAALEAAAWESKARMMIKIDVFSMGGVGRNTVEFLCSLPVETRNRVMFDLKTNSISLDDLGGAK